MMFNPSLPQHPRPMMPYMMIQPPAIFRNVAGANVNPQLQPQYPVFAELEASKAAMHAELAALSATDFAATIAESDGVQQQQSNPFTYSGKKDDLTVAEAQLLQRLLSPAHTPQSTFEQPRHEMIACLLWH